MRRVLKVAGGLVLAALLIVSYLIRFQWIGYPMRYLNANFSTDLISFSSQAIDDRYFTKCEVLLYALGGVHSTTAPQCSSLKARRRFV